MALQLDYVYCGIFGLYFCYNTRMKKLKIIAWLVTFISIFGLVRTVIRGVGVASGPDASWLLPLSIFFIFLPTSTWALYFYRKTRTK